MSEVSKVTYCLLTYYLLQKLKYVIFFCLDACLLITFWNRFAQNSQFRGTCTRRQWILFPGQHNSEREWALWWPRIFALITLIGFSLPSMLKPAGSVTIYRSKGTMAQRRPEGALDTQRLEPHLRLEADMWMWKYRYSSFSSLLTPPPPHTDRDAGACLWLSVLQWKWPPVFLFHKHIKVRFQGYNKEARALVRNP